MKRLLLATVLFGASAHATLIQNTFNCSLGNRSFKSSVNQEEIEFPTLVYETLSAGKVRGSFVGPRHDGSTSKAGLLEVSSSYCLGRSGGHIKFYDETSHCSRTEGALYTEKRQLVSANAVEIVVRSSLAPKSAHDARVMAKASKFDGRVPTLQRTLHCESDLLSRGPHVFVTLHGRPVWAARDRETKSLNIIDLQTGVSSSVPDSTMRVDSVALLDLEEIARFSEKTLVNVSQATCFASPGSEAVKLAIDSKVVKLGSQTYALSDDKKSILAGDTRIKANFLTDNAFVLSDQALCFVR